MANLPLPAESTNELKLADWLELLALLSDDKNSSQGDLESALTTASALESSGPNTVEETSLAVFGELESRAVAAGEAYPFEIRGSIVELKPQAELYSAYLFCLCLSYFRWSTRRNWEISVNPWLLFEELSAIAAEQFIDGKIFRFGTSRGKGNKTATSFRKAVDTLCLKLGEGGGFKSQSILNRKDDKIDLVAWRDFQDQETSKLIMFGQCAGGDDWIDKVTELRPDAFWGNWVRDSAVSPHLRSFYIPHRVGSAYWNFYARKAGIIFDRCRIAYWAFRNNKPILADPRYKEWYEFILRVPTAPARPAKAKTLVARRKKKYA